MDGVLCLVLLDDESEQGWDTNGQKSFRCEKASQVRVTLSDEFTSPGKEK